MTQEPQPQPHQHQHQHHDEGWVRRPLVRLGVGLGIVASLGVIVYSVAPLVSAMFGR